MATALPAAKGAFTQIRKDDLTEIRSTAHSKHRCHYHVTFAPEFRRKEFYGQLRKDIGEIL